MNYAELLVARMTEVEKMNIRRSLSEDAIAARYFDFRPELSGGKLHGGTIEEGITEMKQIRAIVTAKFIESSTSPIFPRGWAF